MGFSLNLLFCGASKKQNKDKDVRDNKKDYKRDI